MKKTLLAILVAATTLVSCVKEKTPVPLTQKQIKQKVDSIMTAKNRTIEENSQKDLQLRLKIEVKSMTDSFLRTRLHTDTAHKAPKL